MVVMADAVVIPAPRGSPPANQLFAALGRFHQALLLQEVSLENDDSVAIESAQDAKQEAGAEIAAILPLACPPAALKA
jgi:hypothetical protein